MLFPVLSEKQRTTVTATAGIPTSPTKQNGCCSSGEHGRSENPMDDMLRYTLGMMLSKDRAGKCPLQASADSNSTAAECES